MYCQISSVVNIAKTVYQLFVPVSKPEGKQSKAQAWEGCDAWRGRSSVTRPPLSPTALHCHIHSTSAAIFTHWHILKISSRISKSSTWFVFVSLKDSVCYENLIIGPLYWGIYFAVNVKCATFCFRAFTFRFNLHMFWFNRWGEWNFDACLPDGILSVAMHDGETDRVLGVMVVSQSGISLVRPTMPLRCPFGDITSVLDGRCPRQVGPTLHIIFTLNENHQCYVGAIHNTSNFPIPYGIA